VSQTRPAAPEPNEIAGRYQVVQKLGAGAFGTVYKARDKTLGRMVAIKTIRLEGLAATTATLQDLQKRFLQEARAGAALKHPNIATVYDVGEAEGMSYLAMEFIDGHGLDRIIADGKVPVGRAAGLAAQVADALGYAHQQGVIHRDIKPANVMVEAGERVKVTDFGIAKVAGAAEQLTQTGSLLGTPSYMSPEQARGEKVDGRSDLFSVGCVLYELLAGRKAFRGDSITALLFKIIQEEPEPLKTIDPLIPDEAIRIVQRALSKVPKTRYQTGSELARDLLALAQPGHVPTLRQADTPTTAVAAPDAPTVATPPTAVSPPTARGTISSSPTVPRATPPATTPPPPPDPRPRRPTAAPGGRTPPREGRGRAFGIAAGGALLAIIATGTWFAFGRGGPAPETPAQSPSAAPTADPGASGAGADAGAATLAPEAESTPTPAAVARAVPTPATPAPAAAAPRGPAPGSAPLQTAPASSGAAPQQPAPPPSEAPAPPPSDAFLDELPEQPPDGRAAGQALAEQYRSGGSSSSSFGSGRSFRRRPRIPPHTPAEQPAVRALAWILSAQNAHHERTGSYGTLDELVEAGDLPLAGTRTRDGFVRRQYRFTVTGQGDAFRAEARPLSPRGRAFYVDDAGFVLVAQ
jgi:serine/threonine-protein kinase